jgi:hypothetical protein
MSKWSTKSLDCLWVVEEWSDEREGWVPLWFDGRYTVGVTRSVARRLASDARANGYLTVRVRQYACTQFQGI